jgi:hypothetical protein
MPWMKFVRKANRLGWVHLAPLYETESDLLCTLSIWMKEGKHSRWVAVYDLNKDSVKVFRA